MSTTLAQGHKQVRELEISLGGRPPAAGISRSKAALTQYVRAYFDRQNAERIRFEKVIAKSRDRVLSLLPKDDPGIKKEIAEAKSFYKARAERRLAKPKREKVESQFVVGSQFVLKGQPFDAEWTFGSVAHANKNDGTYDVAVQSIGDGSLQTAAGVGAWFWSTEADVQKRFAVLLDYSYDWWDSAQFYVAHNDFRTHLGVWGDREQRWLSIADVDPRWSDGVSWTQSHGGSDQARISVDMRFEAAAQSWYLGWIWSNASVYADSGFWGLAASSIHANASIPFMVLGQL